MASDLNNLTREIQENASKLQPGNETQRLSLLHSARTLVNQLEKPHERIMRMVYHEDAVRMATKILIDLGIFKLLARTTEPTTATQLAQDAGADAVLVQRLLKHIATESFVYESGPDTYTANAITRSIASAGAQGAINDTFQVLRMVDAMPDFLRENRYTNPTDKNKSGWTYAYKTSQHYFEYLNSPGNEQKLEAFMDHMDFKTVGLKWFESPELVKAVLGDANVGKDDVLLVDVGGNGGHDLKAFHNAHPSLPGRLVLQDLPTTICSLDSAALARQGIEAVGHDFFTPQPLHGAKAYYLKMCLHDWPDKQCIEILSQLKPALKSGYSRILLDEIVIPEEKAGWFETSLDLLMMMVHSSQERREKEWRNLVDEVGGLRVKQIWDLQGAVGKVIEIEAL